MAKYIRTKDGIYETSQTVSVDFKECYIEAYDTQLERWVKKDIIKQADTIEELCDEFVYEMGAEHTLVTIGYEQIRDNILTCELLDMSNLYGAVWTDKGLIFVAKMNEKGKLELL